MTTQQYSYANTLFSPLKTGDIATANRIWMAPITRNRAHNDGTPHEMAIEYYRQRASAGVIITEATQISPTAIGYIKTPGIYLDKHVEGWKPITKAVHEEGGKIILQLWHVGRISHISLLPEGEQPLAPSAIHPKMTTFTWNGFEDTSPPREMTEKDIADVIADYRQAARNAIRAGFDGVEIHSGNGYLLDEFLHPEANKRTDDYGGSPENRARLSIEVATAVAEEIGAGRVGVRISPTGTFGDVQRHGAETTFEALYDGLGKIGLAYLHVVHKFEVDRILPEDEAWLDELRQRWSGLYIANGDFTAASAHEWIENGKADAVTFGRPFIANPDLPARFRLGAPLNEGDRSSFYGGDHRGYTDYPTLELKTAAA